MGATRAEERLVVLILVWAMQNRASNVAKRFFAYLSAIPHPLLEEVIAHSRLGEDVHGKGGYALLSNKRSPSITLLKK